MVIQSPLEDRSGYPTQATVITPEVSLQATLSYLQSIFDTVREPLVILDSGLRVKTANRSFYQTFQVQPEETEHQFICNLGNGQWNLPSLQRRLESVLTKDASFEDFEVDHEFQHLGRRVMLLNGRRITQEDQSVDLILLAIEDVTARKQAEEAFKLFASKLEQSNRELQDFAFVASHDLQEPLRKIQAFGDLLNYEYGEHLPETAVEYLRRMQNAAARMQVLINDLLAFSRVTTKAQAFVSVDLNRIVQEVLTDLEVHIQQVGAQIEVAPLPVVEAEPLQMRQLFQNLLSNALKFYRPEVPPHITLQAEMLPASALPSEATAIATCQIKVQDNGIGFDEKYLDKIFTIFQRLHYRNEYEGTGIGLAICRKIVERHGGSITASSKLGEGATFIVNLPIRQSPPLTARE